MRALEYEFGLESEEGEKPLAIGSNWERNSKEGTAAESAFGFDQATMQVHDPARDGEAQTGAAGLARAGLIGAVEALENVRQVFFADADATIADFNSGASRPV